ncbi:unnamed protein product [Larinioides sclopetarius]|uniref:Uncharacterized protein n=1 Tax=Larinioides sclopetarius TaxID=280406 RepID=A0AAV1Z5L3_9ARAC
MKCIFPVEVPAHPPAPLWEGPTLHASLYVCRDASALMGWSETTRENAWNPKNVHKVRKNLGFSESC